MLVQFWIGQMKDEILDCLNTNISLFGENNFCLISDTNFLKAKHFINVNTFEDELFKKLLTPCQKSNYIRLKVLIENPTWIYADADVKFNEDITTLFNDGVYFGSYKNLAESYIIKPNGDIDTLKIILKLYIRNNNYTFGCLHKIVRNSKKIIPNTYYTHLENHNSKD
jgi:hypothetical protein